MRLGCPWPVDGGRVKRPHATPAGILPFGRIDRERP